MHIIFNEKSIISGYENGNKYFIRMSLSHDDKYLACGSSDRVCSCSDQDCGKYSFDKYGFNCNNFGDICFV